MRWRLVMAFAWLRSACLLSSSSCVWTQCMEHIPSQAWPVHRSANPAVAEEVEQARTGGCEPKARAQHHPRHEHHRRLGLVVWPAFCSRRRLAARRPAANPFCQLLAAPLPAGTTEGRPSAPSSSGGMRRTNPPHLGRNLFRDRRRAGAPFSRLYLAYISPTSRRRALSWCGTRPRCARRCRRRRRRSPRRRSRTRT
mgnify:CR=1 FL=1